MISPVGAIGDPVQPIRHMSDDDLKAELAKCERSERPGNATLYYPYGAGLVEYNGRYLNSFMYWEAVRFGIDRGLQYLDLGRSQTGSGTYRYKEQWGAKPAQLKYLVYDGGRGAGGPPDRKALSRFTGLWRLAPDYITDRVGPVLIKYILP